MLFLELPVDIILRVISLVTLEDILSLKQTCRVLHAIGCLDIVWHQVTVDLPLDLPLRKDIKALTSSEIQTIAIKALRLERNWCGCPGRPRQLLQIQRDVVIYKMQHLGPNWLVTLARSQLVFRLSIISLNIDLCYHIADSHAVAMSFFADLQSDSTGRIVTIESHGLQTEYLNVYSFALPHEQGTSCPTRKIHGISRHASEGTFSDIQICGDIVAASIAHFMDPVSPAPYELFFINIVTNVRWSCSLIDNIERLRFKLFPDRVVSVGVRSRTDAHLVISVHTLPLSLDSSAKACSSIFQPEEGSHTNLLAHYEIAVPFHGFDFYISVEPGMNSPGIDALPILVFPHLFHHKGTGCIFRIPLSKQMKPLSSFFKTPPRTTADFTCLGGSGRRAIWLRRHWETDSFELMRGNFSRDGSLKVRSLFPKDMALPFEIQNCISLAFDEATGRVYVGLNTGGLYVIKF